MTVPSQSQMHGPQLYDIALGRPWLEEKGYGYMLLAKYEFLANKT